MSPSIFESANFSNQLNTAKNLHMLGRIADAEKIYREILATDKNNTEVMGLLALIAQKQGRLKDAKKLWRQSLAAASPAWIYLRNLNNYLDALLKEGQQKEAATLAGDQVPNWPAVRIPDQGERKMLLSLAWMLVGLERADTASRLLESVAVTLPKDVDLLYQLAKIQERNGDLQAAWESLVAADAAQQSGLDFNLLTDLQACATSLGKQTEARALKDRIAAACPVFVYAERPTQKAGILVLSGTPVFKHEIKSEAQLHFNGNYPSQITKVLADEFRFSSVFSGSPGGRAAAEKLPSPDLIINNFTNAELLLSEGDLAAESAFADSFDVSVINHPGKVVDTSRDRTAELVAGIPGLVVPRTNRFSRTGKSVEDLVKEIEAQYDYPLITRTLSNQEGKGMVKVDDRDTLTKTLSEYKKENFFVTSFVDSRGATGFYRKIRAAIVGTEIIIVRVDWSTYWNVHGRKSDEARIAFYRNNRSLLEEEDRICTDPVRELGQPVMQTLGLIRDRIPLDIFGVDFDVTTDGQLVFYEANATMNLLSTAPPDIDHPKHIEERLVSTLRNYLNSLL